MYIILKTIPDLQYRIVTVEYNTRESYNRGGRDDEIGFLSPDS